MKEKEEALPNASNRNAANRRNFLKGAGMTGLGLAGAAMIGSKFSTGQQKVEAATAVSDIDILNFALNLEYLEAEFYAKSTFGATLVQLGVISAADESGPTTGGAKVPNFGSSPAATMATALRIDEINHVKFLRAALGSRAVKKPAINLNALGYGFSSVASFLKLGRQFEDVGVSAYLGAAPLITSKTYLAAAGAILATEAQHAGSFRLICVMNGVASPAVDSRDIPPTAKTLYDVDKNSLSIPRTTSQVLNIVYGGGRCSGGFYPNGMNGTIVCQS
jgi:hypothetical protein